MSNESNNPTFVFNHKQFLESLEAWEKEQIKLFPDRKFLIRTTVVAMQHYMQSNHLKEAKMVLSGNPELLPIKLPKSMKEWEQPS